MKAMRIDHISLAVKDLSKAREAYEKVLGLELDSTYVSEREKIRVARYYLGDVALELMEPTAPDSEVAKFIERRGEGVFVISYEVGDVDEALAELRKQGCKLIDEKVRHLLGARYAFTLHPKELCGVLTEVIDYRRGG